MLQNVKCCRATRLGTGFVAAVITPDCNHHFPIFLFSSGEAGLLPSSAESDFDFLDVLNSIRKNETMWGLNSNKKIMISMWGKMIIIFYLRQSRQVLERWELLLVRQVWVVCLWLSVIFFYPICLFWVGFLTSQVIFSNLFLVCVGENNHHFSSFSGRWPPRSSSPPPPH